jgi:hypothetical protein
MVRLHGLGGHLGDIVCHTASQICDTIVKVFVGALGNILFP